MFNKIEKRLNLSNTSMKDILEIPNKISKNANENLKLKIQWMTLTTYWTQQEKKKLLDDITTETIQNKTQIKYWKKCLRNQWASGQLQVAQCICNWC